MESRAKVLGHPVHPMLIVFPLGLLATAVIFDIIHLASGGLVWSAAGFYMIGAGIIGGLVAALFGLIDWMAIPKKSRARVVGAWHGIGNVVVVLLFIGSFAWRWSEPIFPATGAYILSFAGFCLALITGWLGGELVDRLGVGVDDGANANAPSSLRYRDATARVSRPERRKVA